MARRQGYVNRAWKYGSVPDDMPEVEVWDDPAHRQRRHRRPDLVALRRARKAQADTGRPVIRAQIIDRDRSTCWICGKLVERDDIHLDHVIPLAKGGAHDPDNIKVACSSCNRWKGSRIVALPARR